MLSSLNRSRIGPFHLFQARKTTKALKSEVESYVIDVLNKLKIALIILPQQTVEMPLTFVKQSGIPIVVIPFAFTTPVITASFLSHRREVWVEWHSLNRRVAKQFPRWEMKYDNRRLLRLPGSRILAFEQLGLAPVNPWVQNAGPSDAVVVESEKMMGFYLAQGIDKDKLIPVGSPSDDILAEGLHNTKKIKAQLASEYTLDMNKPLILCSLPPDQFRLAVEFDNYEEMFAYWMEALTNIPDWQVIFKLHPRMQIQEFDYLQNKFDAKFASEPTAELIAACDLYVAPSTSATLRWAAAAGKPALGYDPYDLGQIAFPEKPASCLIVHNRNDFHETLTRITQDKAYYDSLLKTQQDERHAWGYLDGQVSKRLIDLCDHLVGETRWKK